jgi:hypothetical protein
MDPTRSHPKIHSFIGTQATKTSHRTSKRPEVRHPADSFRRRDSHSHATCKTHRSDLIKPAICTGWVKARYSGGLEEEELMQG